MCVCVCFVCVSIRTSDFLSPILVLSFSLSLSSLFICSLLSFFLYFNCAISLRLQFDSSECGGTFAHPPLHCNSRVRDFWLVGSDCWIPCLRILSCSTSTCLRRSVTRRYRSAARVAASTRPYLCRRRVEDSTPSSSCAATAHRVCSVARPRVQRTLRTTDAG